MLEQLEIACDQKIDTLIFPEMSDTGYDYLVMLDAAQTWDAGTIPALCEAAKKRKLNVMAGVSERTKDAVYNSIVVIDRAGEIVGKYRKTHLCTAEPFVEHQLFGSGSELLQLKIDDVKSGFLNCYEIRFPEIARTLAMGGSTVIFVVSAFPMVL